MRRINIQPTLKCYYSLWKWNYFKKIVEKWWEEWKHGNITDMAKCVLFDFVMRRQKLLKSSVGSASTALRDTMESGEENSIKNNKHYFSSFFLIHRPLIPSLFFLSVFSCIRLYTIEILTFFLISSASLVIRLLLRCLFSALDSAIPLSNRLNDIPERFPQRELKRAEGKTMKMLKK